ncbi:receptor-like serine/threonine-protein kinase ALE2 isoform X2 [Cicer arietinum]|uniref:Receptor-like serine/threonine-protein kinase ALE2 n=1 Tax=Cicer arietinum TaxID=3827 RepID=A0A1S3E1W5_CICAR|nr:receptor-like serine/threonine-protein kinase ALE2 [Cicer arietinum]
MSTSLFILFTFLHFLLYSSSAKLVSKSLSFASSERAKVWFVKPSSGPSPSFQGPSVTPGPEKHPRHRHQYHGAKPYSGAPSPSEGQACGQSCKDPLTTTPLGSPCGCVFPMKVRLLLDAAPLVVFPVINELEIELASGTYLKQSQVRIMGVSADIQNQERTIVDINLVPLGEKFDNTTVVLIYQRFWHKKVPLNRSLFGDYTVLCTTYPGMPSSPPQGTLTGSGPRPSGSASGLLPITTTFISSSKNDKMKLRTIIIIAVSSIFLLLVLVGAFSIIFKWRKIRRPSSAVGLPFPLSQNKRYAMGSILSRRITSPASVSHMSTMDASALSVKTFSLSEIEKATDTFSSQRVLGEGGFGRVYHGTLDDGTDVAVKLLTRDIQSGDPEFIAEVELLCRLHHRNLVKLIGICTEGHKRCLVYELVCNGSVESHLHGVDQRSHPLDWEARKKIALGAARGLAYLHEDSIPRVIHRDFKASNVLLEDDFTPKVSDFGLATEATEGSRSVPTRVMGTFGYVAPEYAMTGHLLVKSDVYSYGVVLLELLTGRKPVDISQPLGEENLVLWARSLLKSREGLEQLVDPTLAGSYDFDEMAKFAAIALMCVQREVTERPFMGEVVQALKLIYNDKDETSVDCLSRKESSAQESEFSSWWNDEPEDITCRLDFRQASSFITMDYSSGPLEELENREFSASNLMGNDMFLPIRLGNRSGPLRTARRSNLSFNRFIGSQSEHAVFPSKRVWNEGYWP